MKRLLYIAAVFFIACAAVFKFLFVGYDTTAAVLVLCSCCCSFFGALHGKKTKAAKVQRITVAVFLLAGFGCFMAAEIPVWTGSRSDEDTSADYVIVMGAGVNGSEPSLSLLSRLEAAYDWLTDNPEGVAVLSGARGPGEDMTEAQCMYDWLLEKGIAPERLILEDQAIDSYENILFSLDLIAAHGGDPTGQVAVVSSEYHLCRIRLIGEALGCEPLGVAARTPYLILYFNYAIREAFALWEIWVFGVG